MKRCLKWFVLIGLGCAILFYAVMMILPRFSSKVNDRDLQVARLAVSDAENGFISLKSAAELIWWPEDQQSALTDLARGTNWNAQLAATALASNKAALAVFDAAMAAPGFQVPEFNIADNLDYLSDWKALANLARLRAEATFHAGNEAEAFEQAMDILRLGGRMQDAGGAIIHYLVGTAVRSMGMSTMRDWVAMTRLSADELRRLERDLRNLEGTGLALTNTIRSEYTFQVRHLADLRAGRVPGQNGVPLATTRLLPVYNERRTQRLFADHARALIAAASGPYTKRNAPQLPKQHPVSLLLSGNAVGEVLYQMTAPATDSVLKAKSRESVQFNATRTLFALRAYQLKHGRLPATLDALVPEFLNAVPADDFDGEPLRFNRAEKRVYSVSTDAKDDDGVETNTKDHLPDYAFLLKF